MLIFLGAQYRNARSKLKWGVPGNTKRLDAAGSIRRLQGEEAARRPQPPLPALAFNGRLALIRSRGLKAAGVSSSQRNPI